jgi:N-acetylmuramoyl-L-alanine amidase
MYFVMWSLAGGVVVGLFAIGTKPEALIDAPASETFISSRVNEGGGYRLDILNTELSEGLESRTSSSVDVDSASLAAIVGQESEMLVTTNVNEYKDTLLIQKTVAPIQVDVVDKPQTTISSDSARNVTEYVVVDGDTVLTVADRFSVSADTIRWANNITGDSVASGTTLKILPITGVLVTSKAGDTVTKIASETNASAEEVALFNDIDVSVAIEPGTAIIVPNGSPRSTPSPTRRGSSGTSQGAYGFAANPVFGGGNTYSRGYCTWHAANRRAAIGRPIPNRMGNAISWARAAASAGYVVDGNPRAGDVLWHRNIGGAGHVAFVEGVNADGSLLVSDMNYPSWGRVTYRNVPPSEFGKYLFIH